MSAALSFLVYNWLWLVLGGIVVWNASLLLPQERPTAFAAVALRVLSRLLIAVPIALGLGIPLGLLVGFFGGGVGTLHAALLSAIVGLLWALYPLVVWRSERSRRESGSRGTDLARGKRIPC